MIALIGSLALVAAPQTTWIVDSTATGLGTGTASNPYSRVDFAVSRFLTVPGDTVLVMPGTYLDEAIDFAGKDITIVSSGGAAVTTLQAVAPTPASSEAIVKLTGGETAAATLEGFTLLAGRGELDFGAYYGGAVYCADSGVTLRDIIIEPTPGLALLPREAGGIYVRDGELVMDNCVIDGTRAEAFSSGRGGGIWARRSSLTLSNSTIRNCFGRDGHGMFLINCALTMTASALMDNVGIGSSGGGAFLTQGSLSMTDCVISGNQSTSSGAGIEARNLDSLSVRRCEFLNNVAGSLPGLGGGITFSTISGQWTLEDSLFAGNVASVGGGISAGGQGIVERCQFFGNEAVGGGFTGSGGAAWGRLTFRHSLFVGNVSSGANGTGGAALGGTTTAEHCTFVDNVVPNPSPMQPSQITEGELRNCIIRGGHAPRIGPGDTSRPTTVTYSNIEGGFAGTGNFDQAESFWPDYRLLPDSPSVDAGDPMSPPDLDGTRVDLGAFLFDPLYCGEGCTGPLGTTTCTGNPNSTGSGAVLTSVGSTTLAEDRVVLNVTGTSPGSLGFFLSSQTGGNMPLGGGSQGTLCMGGSVLRFSNTVLSDRGTGVVSFRLPLQDFPVGTVVQPGDTWIAQYWFRDLNPTLTSNTSSALSLTFQ